MDDARLVEIQREADRAADDAAREARAEVLEREGLDRIGDITPPQRSARRQRKTSTQSQSTDLYHHFVVDVWLTNLNPTEFGIFKRSRNRAKSRQFTTDMDVFAEVIENGKRTGLLGYRKDLWEKRENSDKRLVFKLFTDKLHWRSTMDLMLARSVSQTIGARLLPVMTYSVNSSGENQVVYVERSANKWPVMPENFSFFLLRGGKLEFFRIRQKFIRFGDDYLIYNGRDEIIGLIDGAGLSLMGKWRCRLKKDYAQGPLLNVLKMFAGMLVFNDACRSHVRRCAAAVRRGVYEPKLEKQETDLYMNPRRVR
ncbi:MAG: hypothetical protein ACFCUN_10050 [Hyphomicrobiaceae bacterium]